MADHVHIMIAHRTDNPPRHRGWFHLKFRMDRRDYPIEFAQDVVGQVKRAVLKNVDFDAAQDRDPAHAGSNRFDFAP